MANGISKAKSKDEALELSRRFEQIRKMIVLHFEEEVGLSTKDAQKLAGKMVEIAEESHIESRSLKL